ncbi:hypothetical protein [Dictyobacter arantiisoli]|uniref:Uncharacterized protein n=1 Tax=Dictyobacter arantiisoli TaxID=2014874 RepID=A0A5A5TBJ0_9CHLR|nr:hypothetical protein [Dictyobacter arantiisoli]GCF08727.1 hypothetical protein KDI_22910 [Dictyobacter arantiisoli]
MSEVQLFASSTPGRYAIGTPYGPDVVNGQALTLLVGGHWISGRIRYQNQQPGATKQGEPIPGTYALAQMDDTDTVMEASEESFPASDSPAWAGSTQAGQSASAGQVASGYYFVADMDGSVCGLCAGMRVRP